MPWYSIFNLVRHQWVANFVRFSEREPYGHQGPRIRKLVTAAIKSGDSSKAGQFTNPGRIIAGDALAGAIVKGELARIRQPTLIIHPRDDDRAGLGNAAYLQGALGGMVEACVLDDSYHVITVDRQRDLVVQRTRRLRRLSQRSRAERPPHDTGRSAGLTARRYVCDDGCDLCVSAASSMATMASTTTAAWAPSASHVGLRPSAVSQPAPGAMS